jgi:hypothetical protein
MRVSIIICTLLYIAIAIIFYAQFVELATILRESDPGEDTELMISITLRHVANTTFVFTIISACLLLMVLAILKRSKK